MLVPSEGSYDKSISDQNDGRVARVIFKMYFGTFTSFLFKKMTFVMSSKYPNIQVM